MLYSGAWRFDKKMEKIYHIYNKENKCVSPCLSEEEFRVQWEDLTETLYEYEELENNRTITHNASY